MSKTGETYETIPRQYDLVVGPDVPNWKKTANATPNANRLAAMMQGDESVLSKLDTSPLQRIVTSYEMQYVLVGEMKNIHTQGESGEDQDKDDYEQEQSQQSRKYVALTLNNRGKNNFGPRLSTVEEVEGTSYWKITGQIGCTTAKHYPLLQKITWNDLRLDPELWLDEDVRSKFVGLATGNAIHAPYSLWRNWLVRAWARSLPHEPLRIKVSKKDKDDGSVKEQDGSNTVTPAMGDEEPPARKRKRPKNDIGVRGIADDRADKNADDELDKELEIGSTEWWTAYNSGDKRLEGAIEERDPAVLRRIQREYLKSVRSGSNDSTLHQRDPPDFLTLVEAYHDQQLVGFSSCEQTLTWKDWYKIKSYGNQTSNVEHEVVYTIKEAREEERAWDAAQQQLTPAGTLANHFPFVEHNGKQVEVGGLAFEAMIRAGLRLYPGR